MRPTMMPPKTPVSMVGIPMLVAVSIPRSFALTPIVARKNRKSHRACQRRHAVVVGQADCDTNGEEQREVGKDCTARLSHDLRDALRQPREVRAANTKQDTRHGKHRDGQHHAFADLLEIGEGAREDGHNVG